MKTLLACWVCIGVCVGAGPSFGQDNSDTRSAGAHVHGQAQLAMALDGDQLFAEFRSPLWNIIGFERKPTTEAELATFARAQDTLNTHGALFELDGQASCTLESASSDLPDMEELASHDHGASDHSHNHDHDHSHDHDGHGHDDGTDHHEYSDVVVTHTYKCANAGGLRQIQVTAFDSFENIESIEVVFLSDTAQISDVAEPDQTTVRIQ